jgi:hypothetical protein
MKFALAIIFFALVSCGNPVGNITQPPVGLGGEEPSLVATDNGLVLSWQEPYEGDIILKMSVHDGASWSPAKAVAKGDDWFVNWADFPAIVANGDKLFVHYLQKTSSTSLAYNVMFLISPDLGETWSAPQQLHQDTVTAEHGFVSAIPYEEGFYVSWLDGRETIGNKGNFTLRGVYVKNEVELINSALIDDNTCTCCQTTMAIVNNVPWTFYRNRTEEEIRDIYYSKLVDGSWSEPTSLNDDNWHIPGCPVNGPVAASFGDNLVVAWFTGADGENNVKLKVSTNSGNSFSEEILVEGPRVIGRVDVKMNSEKIYVTYIANSKNGTVLKLKVYDFSGELIGRETLATLSAERGTGFPRAAIWHNDLVIAWTDVEKNSIKVITHSLDEKSYNSKAGVH